MNSPRKALLIVNLGTPDNPTILSVGQFLFQFLHDRRVIDIPLFFRILLVNLIIIPFRVYKSSRIYRKLWSGGGSPILNHMQCLTALLQDKLDGKYEVTGAMRYGRPGLKQALKRLESGSFHEITVFPLFPQYASSTSGSVMSYILKVVSRWEVIPELHITGQYGLHPAFIRTYGKRILDKNPLQFDHVIFTYHSLPLRQINKVHPGHPCSNCRCESEMPDYGLYCYRAVCHATSRSLAETIRLPAGKYTTTFQSRLAGKWLAPFTGEVIGKLAREGKKNLLVVAPSFVSDCLETIIEIGQDYRDLFICNGGSELVLLESLNCGPDWANCILEIIDSPATR